MNLLHSPSLTELSALIKQCDTISNSFHLIVEHDGEVLAQCASANTKGMLNKYKFYIHGLRGKGYAGASAAGNLRYLNQLYKNLLYCWENDLAGAIDYDKISGIQNLTYWLEAHSAAQPSEDFISSILYEKDSYQQHRTSM